MTDKLLHVQSQVDSDDAIRVDNKIRPVINKNRCNCGIMGGCPFVFIHPDVLATIKEVSGVPKNANMDGINGATIIPTTKITFAVYCACKDGVTVTRKV